MDIKKALSEISTEDQSPLVKKLIDIISECNEIIEKQAQEISYLKDEIARMKGGNIRPHIKPSILEKESRPNNSNKRKTKRKKKRLKINQEYKLHPEDIPEGSKFKGYRDYFIQDITIKPNVIRYRRGVWITPEGKRIIASLPGGINGHYGTGLKQYILHLNYDLNVPQNMILESLNELGIQISAGELHKILTEDHDVFHSEKDQLLDIGLKIFPFLSVDDTGARHKGRNGYCTHIGNDFFSYFKSTESKSRINFLKILRGNRTDYTFTSESFEYMHMYGLVQPKYNRLKGAMERIIADENEWKSFLRMIGIRGEKETRIITEAALLGSILYHGINRDIVIVSDEAGQFEITLHHALCWLHAERKLSVLIPINDYQRKIIEDISNDIWNLYSKLKAYKKAPDEKKKSLLEKQFDDILTQETEFKNINKALQLIFKNKKELLLVLDRPEIPLHNNMSENPIRSFVTKRKIHGGTRSETGRRCRDTFISLKKTCRKLGISFREYLFDRLSGNNNIPSLSNLMKEMAFPET